ncbi:MAG: hypothetical protein ACRYF5_18660 [Janthinobacterium lividum]
MSAEDPQVEQYLESLRALGKPDVDIVKDSTDHESMTNLTRQEFEARLETAEARMNGRLEVIETRMDGRLDSMEQLFKAGVSNLEALQHKATADLMKWLVGTALGIAAVGLSLMTFLINSAIPKIAPPTPAPVVLQIPQYQPPTIPATKR